MASFWRQVGGRRAAPCGRRLEEPVGQGEPAGVGAGQRRRAPGRSRRRRGVARLGGLSSRSAASSGWPRAARNSASRHCPCGPSWPTRRATRSAASGWFSSSSRSDHLLADGQPVGRRWPGRRRRSPGSAAASRPWPWRRGSGPGARRRAGRRGRSLTSRSSCSVGLVEVLAGEQDAGVEQDRVGRGVSALGGLRGVCAGPSIWPAAQEEAGRAARGPAPRRAARRRAPRGSRSASWRCPGSGPWA